MKVLEALSAATFSLSSSAEGCEVTIQPSYPAKGGTLTYTQPCWSFYPTLVSLFEVDGQPERDSGVHGRVEWSEVSLHEWGWHAMWVYPRHAHSMGNATEQSKHCH